MRDLYSNLDVRTAFVPNNQTATVVGTPVDMAGMKSALFLFSCGAAAASGLFTPLMEESDDNVTYTAVTAKNLISDATSPLTTNWCARVGYIGRRRYVRASAVWVSGTSLRIGCVAVLRPLRLPVA